MTFNGIISIWKVRIREMREFSNPRFARILYRGIMFITTGIINKPSIRENNNLLALNSNLDRAYPAKAQIVTFRIILPKLTIKLLYRLFTIVEFVKTKA